MNGAINKVERITQNRVVSLFKNQLKCFYPGNLEGKHNNSNIENRLLRQYLAEQDYSTEQKNKALDKLQTTATNHAQDLYHNTQSNCVIYPDLVHHGKKRQIVVNEWNREQLKKKIPLII